MEDTLIKKKAMMEDTLVKEEVLPQSEVGKTKAEKPKHSFVDIVQSLAYMLPIAILFGFIVFIVGGALINQSVAIADCIKDSSGAACAEHKKPSESVLPNDETDFRE
jgi:hypothetical protein